jgi:hypothetical protein
LTSMFVIKHRSELDVQNVRLGEPVGEVF